MKITKITVLVLIIAILIVVLGNSGGNKSDNPQVKHIQSIQRGNSTILTMPRYVEGIKTIDQETTFLPMITWTEKKVDGGTVCYARPISE